MSQARVRPSGLALTHECNASLQLQESVPPQPPTEEKAEGTAAHWVARRYAAGYAHELPVGAKFHNEGREWEVTRDMATGAAMYARVIGGYHPDLHLEEPVEVPEIHETECRGTPDASRFFLDAREAYPIEAAQGICPEGLPAHKFAAGTLKLLRLPDYKFGHRHVEVFENAQLTAYTFGSLRKLGLSHFDTDLYVEMILVQPRSYHRDGPVRIWRVQAAQLVELRNKLQYSAYAALGPNPVAKTGTHCLDCEARYVCKTLQHATGKVVEFSETAERIDLPPEAVGVELAIIDDAMTLLKARRTGLAAQAETLVRLGHLVPNYHMEPGESNLTYYDNVDVQELLGLGDLVGIDLRRTQSLKDQVVTPTQAIALGIDRDVMKSYAHRPPGKTKLVRDDSTTARKVFSK